MRTLPLHAAHEALSARFGARAGAELVLGYGSLDAERRAIRQAAGLVDRSFRALLHVAGRDARAFLHGMVTNEVKALPPGAGAHQTVVTAKGRMLADGRLLVVGDEDLLLDLPPEGGAATLEHLSRYLVSEDAAVGELTGSWVVLGLVGPRAGAVLARLTEPLPALPLHHHVRRVLAGAEALVARAEAEGVDGFDVYVNAAGAGPVFEALRAAVEAEGGAPVGDEALDAVRIEEFRPRFGADMDEETLPLEANLEAAISYRKGCYIGQEVIAKATYRGAVARKLAQLRVPAGARAGQPLLLGERVVGALTSVGPAGEGGALALGMVRRSALVAGATFALEGGGAAELVRLPPAPAV